MDTNIMGSFSDEDYRSDIVWKEFLKRFIDSDVLSKIFGNPTFYFECTKDIFYNSDFLSTDFSRSESVFLPVSKRRLISDVSDFFSECGIRLADIFIFDINGDCGLHKTSPFKIPIFIDKSKEFHASVAKQMVLDLIKFNEEYFKSRCNNFNSSFAQYICDVQDALRQLNPNSLIPTHIEISKHNRGIMTYGYAHELIHTQAGDDIGNSLRVNNETLPIFTEGLLCVMRDKTGHVTSFASNTRKKTNFSNMKHILFSPQVESADIQLTEMYLASTLQANYLLSIYLGSSDSVRKEIIRDINGVFSQDLTVEEVLSKYDCSLEAIPKPYVKEFFSVAKK